MYERTSFNDEYELVRSCEPNSEHFSTEISADFFTKFITETVLFLNFQYARGLINRPQPIAIRVKG